jgi:hypothetical protein
MGGDLGRRVPPGPDLTPGVGSLHEAARVLDPLCYSLRRRTRRFIVSAGGPLLGLVLGGVFSCPPQNAGGVRDDGLRLRGSLQGIGLRPTDTRTGPESFGTGGSWTRSVQTAPRSVRVQVYTTPTTAISHTASTPSLFGGRSLPPCSFAPAS